MKDIKQGAQKLILKIVSYFLGSELKYSTGDILKYF